MMTQYISLVCILLAVLAASVFGAGFEAGAWYQDLNNPVWTPPDWLYGPAWAVIYLLMAVAAWRVWLSRKSVRLGALLWWMLALTLNVVWSWLMFGLRRPGWAFALSVILLGLAIMCSRAFHQISSSAGAMLIPFVLWLMFVVYLNYTIWAMNLGGFGHIFS